MKSLSTILAAALVAGSCTVALAQGGTSGAGGADSTQQGTMKDADKNPTAPGANPAAGNTGATPMTGGQVGTGAAPSAPSGMQTAPASNTRADSPQRPAGAQDNTGGATGQSGSTK